MLASATDFPLPGSFALYRDDTLPIDRQRPELARILERGPLTALISLPLRLGAGGNRRVPIGDLIDGTPLTKDEERELADIQRALRSRVRGRAKLETRAKALRDRSIWMICLRSERARFDAQQAVEQRRVA